jgi:hypothetical protein
MTAPKKRAIGIDTTLRTFLAPFGRRGGKSRNRPKSTICSGFGGVVVDRAIVPISHSTSSCSIDRRALGHIHGASAERVRLPMLIAVEAMRPTVEAMLPLLFRRSCILWRQRFAIMIAAVIAIISTSLTSSRFDAGCCLRGGKTV